MRHFLATALTGLLPFVCSVSCFCALSQSPEADRITLLEREVIQQRRLINDWGGLLHYGSDDTELHAPAPDENRVVFLGDQLTESWGEGGTKFFPGRPYINRGIKGQTTSQLLVRFRQDVIELQPKVVVILAGLNDVAGVHGPATAEMILENLMSMTDLAKAHGIKVVLSSLLPVCDCFAGHTGRERLLGRIGELNSKIKGFAFSNGLPYLDYHSVLAGSDKRVMKKELTVDGIIPDDAGYALMAPLAEQAIQMALRQ